MAARCYLDLTTPVLSHRSNSTWRSGHCGQLTIRLVQMRITRCAIIPFRNPALGVLERQRLAGVELIERRCRAFTRSGHVYLKTPNKSMQPVVISPETKPFYLIRARVERSQYERPPKLLAIRTNTVSAHQAETCGTKCWAAAMAARSGVSPCERSGVAAIPCVLKSTKAQVQ